MVQQEICDKLSSERLKVYVVWTPVLREDDRQAARRAAAAFPDHRAVHFWDADKSLGHALGKIVKLPRKRTFAWDVYFAFDTDAEWKEQPPQPTDWMHQLGTDDRLLDGYKFRSSVEKILRAAE